VLFNCKKKGAIDIYLQGILPRKALITHGAGKRLHSEMYPLVPLQVVVSVETLDALVTLERPFVLLLSGRVAVHVMSLMRTQSRMMIAHAVQWTHHGQGGARLMHVAHDGAGHVMVRVRADAGLQWVRCPGGVSYRGCHAARRDRAKRTRMAPLRGCW